MIATRRRFPWHKPRLERDGTDEIRRMCQLIDRRSKLIRLHTHLVLADGRHLDLAEAGTTDWLWLLNERGRHMLIEQKSPTGVLSAEQLDWHAWARQAQHPIATVVGGGDVKRAYDEEWG